MLQGLLNRTYFANTGQEWLVAVLIVLGAIVVGRLLYWILSSSIRRYTRRTETRFDDLIVDMIEKSITFVITLVGIWYGLKTLTLSDSTQEWIGTLFQLLVILTSAWLLTRLLDSLHAEYLVPLAQKTGTDLDDQLLPVVRTAMKASLWIIAFVIALDNAGYDVGALLAGLGIGGLALAMAAKDTVSNIFGGFTIFADQPFTLNDRIRVSGYDGFIRQVGLRSTRLETLDGTVVTIPNSTFSVTPVENVSLEPVRKMVLRLGLTYDTTPERMEKAMQLLTEIARTHSNVDEKVLVGFTGFGDSSMNLSLIYYIKKGTDILGTQTAINLAILNTFNSHGIEFAFPTQTLYTKAL